MKPTCSQSSRAGTPSARARACGLVAAAEADRRPPLGEQPDWPVPFVATTSGDISPSSTRLRRKRSACAVARECRLTPSAREHLGAVRGEERDQAVGRRLAAPRAAGHHDRMRPAVPAERARRRHGARPRSTAARARASRARDAGTRTRPRRRTRRRRTSAPRTGSRRRARRGSPPRARRGPSRRPDPRARRGTRRRRTRRAQTESSTARSGACPSATAWVSAWCSVGRDTVTMSTDVPSARVPDHLRPGALLGHDDANLGLVGTPTQPVRVDERPTAPVPQDHALLGELRQRAASPAFG